MANPRTLQTEVIVNAPRERVWDALFTRFGEAYRYNPSLDSSHFVKGETGGVGCERQCALDAKTSVVEQITRADVMRSFSVNIIGGNMPMVNSMIVDLELKDLQPGRTKVMLKARYTSKPAFVGGMMKGMMRAKFTDMLIGLKYYLETGQEVSKKTYKGISRSYRRRSPEQSFPLAA